VTGEKRGAGICRVHVNKSRRLVPCVSNPTWPVWQPTWENADNPELLPVTQVQGVVQYMQPQGREAVPFLSRNSQPTQTADGTSGIGTCHKNWGPIRGPRILPLLKLAPTLFLGKVRWRALIQVRYTMRPPLAVAVLRNSTRPAILGSFGTVCLQGTASNTSVSLLTLDLPSPLSHLASSVSCPR
jgi:hypothetical protein